MTCPTRLPPAPSTPACPARAVRRRRPARGLGMVELLVCVSISSMLLTAVALAFRASFNSYRDSQARGQMLNSGRGFMSQIIADIRMSDAGGPYDPSAGVSTTEAAQYLAQMVPGNPTPGPPAAGGSGVIGIQLAKTHPDAMDPNASPTQPAFITYWFDAPNQQIWMSRQCGPTQQQSVVCTCVQGFQLYLQPVLVPANPQTGAAASIALLRATALLTMANKDASGRQILPNGDQALTLVFSDAAMPRRSFGGI